LIPIIRSFEFMFKPHLPHPEPDRLDGIRRIHGMAPPSKCCLMVYFLRIVGTLPTILRNTPLDEPDLSAGHGLIITILMFVISSQVKRTPSRPRPESLFPPYGMWSTRKMEVSLIITPPTLIRSTAYIAFFMSLV